MIVANSCEFNRLFNNFRQLPELRLNMNADSSKSDDSGSESGDESWDDEERGPSRSQVRRDALFVRYLAIEIGELSPSARAQLPLPEELVAGMEELDRISHKNARKRHIGFLSKMMRNMDIEPIETAMEMRRQAARANSHIHHSIEQWRDRLMGIDEAPDPKAALTDFLNQYPNADRQPLSQLQRKTLQEINRLSESSDHDSSVAQRQPPSARQLFKFIRDVVTETS